jgi:hypothetical protein
MDWIFKNLNFEFKEIKNLRKSKKKRILLKKKETYKKRNCFFIFFIKFIHLSYFFHILFFS